MLLFLGRNYCEGKLGVFLTENGIKSILFTSSITDFLNVSFFMHLQYALIFSDILTAFERLIHQGLLAKFL